MHEPHAHKLNLKYYYNMLNFYRYYSHIYLQVSNDSKRWKNYTLLKTSTNNLNLRKKESWSD